MIKQDQKTGIYQNANWEAKQLLGENILDKTDINFIFTDPEMEFTESRTLQGNRVQSNLKTIKALFVRKLNVS